MLINTEVEGVPGQTDSERMRRKVIHQDNYDEDGGLHDSATVIEWWLDGACVHRSANVVVWRSPEEMKPLIGLMGSGDNGNKEKRE